MIPQQLDLLPGGASTDVTGNALWWQGGIAAFEVAGTLGGATVTLQVLGADGNWVAFSTATTVTAVGIVQPVYLPAGPVRAVITGGTGETGIYASLKAIQN